MNQNKIEPLEPKGKCAYLDDIGNKCTEKATMWSDMFLDPCSYATSDPWVRVYLCKLHFKLLGIMG